MGGQEKPNVHDTRPRALQIFIISHVSWDVPRYMGTFWSPVTPWDLYSSSLGTLSDPLLLLCRLRDESGRDAGSISFPLHSFLATLRTTYWLIQGALGHDASAAPSLRSPLCDPSGYVVP